MRLVINDPDGIVEYRFCTWLISQIQREYLLRVNIKKYSFIDEYLSTLDFMKNHSGATSHSIVQAGLSRLVVNSDEDSFTIHINDTMLFDPENGIKLNSMCKLINYGTISVKGYSIITDLFTYFAENIDMLLKYYYTYVARS
jgi:hypothetical protein